MQTHSLIQGTPSWHAYRNDHDNASDAPAMMGASPYKTRTQLLHEKATGAAKEVDSFTQALFDDGHRFEELARPLAEKIIGQELYPVVGSLGRLSASFDGLTLCESIALEHKTLNDEIRAAQSAADLGAHLRIQMEQQLMVCDGQACLFLATKWDADGNLVEEKHFWYESNAALRADIVAGWAQFHIDRANYQHVEVLPAAVAAPVKDLPALSIRVDGKLTLNHNLVLFGAKLQSFIEEINQAPDDDQSFADAEAAIKVMERAESALESAEGSALAQISSVDDMVRTVAMYKELARKTRLMLEKMVKARKETIRVEIQQAAKDKAAAHIAGLNARIGKPYMPAIAVDFAGVMKGKKTVASLRDACDTELARFKIEANAAADKIQLNLTTLKDLGGEFPFLFADTATIVLKDADDLTALVKLRIAEHQKAEAAKAEALRAKIAEEERIKAEAAAAEKARIERVTAENIEAEKRARAELVERDRVAVETKRQLEEKAAAAALERQTNTAAPVAQHGELLNPAADWPPKAAAQVQAAPPEVRPAAPSTPPTLRLGQISERLGFTVTADFLRALGFEPAARDKAALLFHEREFPMICAAIIRHISAVQAKLAA